MKNLFIKTYGCQMNVYDSDKIKDVLAPLGYQQCEFPEQADMILLNTCHIREKATEKVFSELGRMKVFKEAKAQQGKEMILGVAGCVAQAEGALITKRAPFVDMVFGPQSYHALPEMVTKLTESAKEKKQEALIEEEKPAHPSLKDMTPQERAALIRQNAPVIHTHFETIDKFDNIPLPPQAEGVSAFLTIQEGCDKFCTFCCVPYTRGAEHSRPIADILKEARHLVSLGVKEITLLGQNVTAFHGQDPQGKGEWTMARLLLALSDIPGLERIRYTTSHPRDIGDDLIAAHKASPLIMPFLHLPVQSGSNRLLKVMNRKHDRDMYFNVIDKFRGACPDMAFSSDFIVGYPGETEADFRDTMDLIERVHYAIAYSFKYSPRPGTPAARHEDQVPEAVKTERLDALQTLLKSQQTAYNESMIGRKIPVLFEKKGRHDGQYIGRSPYLQSVHAHFDTDVIGQTHMIDIHTASLNSLGGIKATE